MESSLYEMSKWIYTKKKTVGAQKMPITIPDEFRAAWNVKWPDNEIADLWRDMAPQF